MNEALDYKKDIEVDRYQLEVLWENQAKLYGKWSEESVKAADEVDRCKSKIKLLRDTLNKDVRLHPEKYGIEGTLREAAISSAIDTDQKVRELEGDLQDLVYQERIFKGVLVALDHKKKALEYLSQLFISGYYATPREPKKAEESYNTKVKEAMKAKSTQKLMNRKKLSTTTNKEGDVK
jgi:hypothetical protein